MSVFYLLCGIGALVISAPYFLSRRVRTALRQSAMMVNGRDSAVVRATTTIFLFLICLGLSATTQFGFPVFAGTAAGHVVVVALAIAGAVSLILVFSQVLFNQPKILAAKEFRSQPGAAFVIYRRLVSGAPVSEHQAAVQAERAEAWGRNSTEGQQGQFTLAPGEVVLYHGLANRRQTELRWVGGTLLLTGTGLYFKPNQIDRQFNGSDWTLPGKAIISAGRFKTPENQFRDVLRVEAADGSVDQFVVNKIDKVVRLIQTTFNLH